MHLTLGGLQNEVGRRTRPPRHGPELSALSKLHYLLLHFVMDHTAMVRKAYVVFN